MPDSESYKIGALRLDVPDAYTVRESSRERAGGLESVPSSETVNAQRRGSGEIKPRPRGLER